jgi:hypothetical protein
MEFLVFAAIFWILPIFVAHSIGKSKHRSGWLYGFLLGWIGVLVIALLPARPNYDELPPEQQLQMLERNMSHLSQEQVNAAHAEIVAKLQANLATATRECPHCKEAMRRDASVCPHCQRDSEPWKFHDGYWWLERGSTWFWLNEATGEWQPATAGAAHVPVTS